MASSNRHWPSLFKSKPAALNPWQNDNISPPTPNSHRPVGGGAGAGDERSPEPKPRWNPKPEQIRILESIFNSGMVNPPRDEIRRIRVQLQEFGQVGDANVFYWFQNRKSRSKHKLRHLTSKPPSAAAAAPSSSSSSSSDNNKQPSPRGAKRTVSGRDQNGFGGLLLQPSPSPPPATLPQQHSYDFFSPAAGEPFFLSGQQSGFCFDEPTEAGNNVVGPCTSLLLSDILNLSPAGNCGRKLVDGGHDDVDNDVDGGKKLQLDSHQLCYGLSGSVVHPSPAATTSFPCAAAVQSSFLNQIPGMGGDHHHHHHHQPESRATVFINDVAFEVGTGPFNVREAFGDDMLLVHSSGQPVLTDDWGITLHSLHHGAFYYLI